MVKFSTNLETLSEPFLVSTPVGDLVIARRVYLNFPVTVSQKVTSVDLIELEIRLQCHFRHGLVTFLLYLSRL